MSAVDELLKMATWTKLEQYQAEAGAEGLPYATHEGELEIMGHKLRCYRLNTGQAVINADDAHAFFGGLVRANLAIQGHPPQSRHGHGKHP